MSRSGIRLRPIQPSDHDFLLALFASTRRDEFSLMGLDDAQLDALITQQFEAQIKAFDAYTDREYSVVEELGRPIGRLLLATADGDLRVVDIALVPERRGRGVGSALMADVIATADAERRPVSLHVERWNPAFRLYERLGFEVVADGEIYAFMRRPVNASPT